MRLAQITVMVTVAVLGVDAQELAQFELVAEVSDGSIFDGAQLTEGGDVAFALTRTDGSQAIYAGSPGRLRTVVRTGEALPANGGIIAALHPTWLSINASNTVVFVATLSDRQQLIAADDAGHTRVIARGDDEEHRRELRWPVINSSGMISFFAGGSCTEGNYLWKDGTVTTVAIAAASCPTYPQTEFFALNDPTDLNDAGEVVFWGDFNIYVFGKHGRQLRLSSAYVPAALNNAGVVTAIGHPSGAGPLVRVQKDGAVARLTETNPGTESSISDAGEVVFRDLSGLYISSRDRIAPQTRSVLKYGEQLFSATVLSIQSYQNALNNSGDIAFTATLDDGRSVVAIAHTKR